MARRDMLAEYFSVHVSPDGMVESLPLLLRDYTPNLDKLPSFLMRLGPQVTHLSGLFSLWIIEISWLTRSTGLPRPTVLVLSFANSHIFTYQDLLHRRRSYHLLSLKTRRSQKDGKFSMCCSRPCVAISPHPSLCWIEMLCKLQACPISTVYSRDANRKPDQDVYGVFVHLYEVMLVNAIQYKCKY